MIPERLAIKNYLKMIKKKRQAIFLSGQGTLEYLLILTAALLVIIAAVAGSNGPVRKGLDSYVTGTGNKIGDIVEEFNDF